MYTRKRKYVSLLYIQLATMALNDIKSPEQPGQIFSDRNTSQDCKVFVFNWDFHHLLPFMHIKNLSQV